MASDHVELGFGEVPHLIKDRDTGEMRPNPDFPKDRACKSGHVAPEGTRFFATSGTALAKERYGLYCELCLMVANKHRRLVKAGKAEVFDFAAELNYLVQEAERKNRAATHN